MTADMNEIDDLGFTGKIVSFGQSDDVLAVRFLRFEWQHGRLFVTGEIPKGTTSNDWAERRPCAVAWDQVTDYMVFDSEEQYVEAMAKNVAEGES